jgi:hypothetical protein
MEKWSMEPKNFTGTLSKDSDQVDIAFTAGLDTAGEVILTFSSIPFDKRSEFISRHFHVEGTRFAKFLLSGRATDGTTFECDNVIFTNLQNKFEENSATIAPVAHYSLATLIMVEDHSNQPVLRWRIKGFESFRTLKETSPLGSVEMVGGKDMNGKNEIAGWIQVRANSTPQDIEEWRKNADALCLHLHHVMSFAASVKLACPVSEFFHNGLVRIEAYSQGPQQKSNCPVFSWLDLDHIFRCAVRSHFEPAFSTHNLYFAIQWFNMHGTYREADLISSMTVLENLIDSNLSEEDTLILSLKKFEKLRRKLSAVIKEQAAEWTDNQTEQQAFVHEFNNRLSDLKRRSLIDKITLLARRWGVKLDDIPEANIREAKSARDQIVHRGHYKSKSGMISDLHDHVLTVRELVVRFILTALQFEGCYMSYLGGYRAKEFRKNPAELGYAKGKN